MDTFAHIQKHAPNVALQFSGGRDSLAMLLMLRPYWDQLTVYWCNAGDAYPETLELMASVRSMVPHFVEVQGHVAEVHAALGWPSDVLQAGAGWPFGTDQFTQHVKLVDRHVCCYRSMMEPTHQRMKADGISLVLRGQRDEDSSKSHVKSGEVVDGITIVYPIASWTTDEVDGYLAEQGWQLPSFYREGLASMPDCMHCTAWLEHGAVRYVTKHHPAQAQVVNARLKTIYLAVAPFVEQLAKAQEDINGMG